MPTRGNQQRGKVRLSRSAADVMVNPPTTTQAPTNEGCTTGIVIALIIAALIGISKCSSSGTSSSDANTSNPAAVEQNLSAAVAAQSPPPVEPLNASSVGRGLTHLRLAQRAEGFSGAMIYSQNCYDALSRKFSWAKLDTCGAFDMLTVRSLPDADVSGLDKEVSYFEAETAAGRYLAAATGAGESTDDADKRLSKLQARVVKAPALIKPPPPTTSDEAADEPETDDPATDDSNNTATADQAWLDRGIANRVKEAAAE